MTLRSGNPKVIFHDGCTLLEVQFVRGRRNIYLFCLVGRRATARELGIDEVRADLKPEDKIKHVEALEHKYGAVAMVGDGINNAPALARATVVIAVGTAETGAKKPSTMRYSQPKKYMS
ncbi:MAG: HAD family hydrolase [Candidatus Marinimicrobia bacterium]|nr:HAD family hydrolase [Candidatus Neomarinimicrobiota bacterium]